MDNLQETEPETTDVIDRPVPSSHQSDAADATPKQVAQFYINRDWPVVPIRPSAKSMLLKN